MKQKLPPASRSWSREAQVLWRAVHAEFRLDQHHETLLKQVCELLTRADQARQEIAKSGLSIPDRYGGTKPSPFLEIERHSVNAARLTLREIGLDYGANSTPEESVRLPRSKGYE